MNSNSFGFADEFSYIFHHFYNTTKLLVRVFSLSVFFFVQVWGILLLGASNILGSNGCHPHLLALGLLPQGYMSACVMQGWMRRDLAC